jgi:hypothetical protein
MAPILLLGCRQCSFPDEKPITLFRIIQLGVKTADFKILNFLAETQKYHLQSWLDIHKTSYDQS